MARHRNVRSMNYEDEYYDDEDADMYSRSVEDNYCISPSTVDQFTYKPKERNLSSFMSDSRIEEDEEEEAGEAGGGGAHATVEEEQLQFSDLGQAQFDSCMEGIKTILGDTVPEESIADAILRNNYNMDAAVNDLLSLQGAPKQQREPRQRNRSSGDSVLDSDSDIDSLSNTPKLFHDFSLRNAPAFMHFGSSITKSSSRSTVSDDSESLEGTRSELQVGSVESDVFVDLNKPHQSLGNDSTGSKKVDTNANLMNCKSSVPSEKVAGDAVRANADTVCTNRAPTTISSLKDTDFTKNAASLTFLARQHEQNEKKLGEISLRNMDSAQVPPGMGSGESSSLGLQTLSNVAPPRASQAGVPPKQPSLADLAALHQQQMPKSMSLLSGSLLDSVQSPGMGQTVLQASGSLSQTSTVMSLGLGLPSLSKGLALDPAGSGLSSGLGLKLGAAAPSVSLSSLARLHQQGQQNPGCSSTSLPSSVPSTAAGLGLQLGATSSTPSLSSLALFHQQAAGSAGPSLSLLNMPQLSPSVDSSRKAGEQGMPAQTLSLADLAAQHSQSTAAAKASLTTLDGPLSSLQASGSRPVTEQPAAPKAPQGAPISLLSALRIKPSVPVVPVKKTRQPEVRSRSPSPVPLSSNSAVSQSAVEAFESDISLVMTRPHTELLQARPSVLARAIGCQMNRRECACPYWRFSYRLQSRGCRRKPIMKSPYTITPFDFSTPSPDDMIKEKQKMAFTRVEGDSFPVQV